ncbi:extracellular solute-binding protein [Enterocloster asparagiformis]|nr:extracellular solute-binding protein [Enterocloster asparagiformis]
MATIKDIAALAGVSHGTVSNVLNGRGNVSVEKITLVENAARQLGYTINAQARQLRKGTSKRVGVIVPRIGIKRYQDLYLGIEQELKGRGYEVDLHYTNDLTHCEEKILEDVEATNPIAVVLVSAFGGEVRGLRGDGRLILAERSVEKMPEDAVYCGFDYGLAGREMAKRCLGDGHRNAAVFTGNTKYSNYGRFVKGIQEVFAAEGGNVRVFSSDESLQFHTAFELLTDREEFDAVIASDPEAPACLAAAASYRGRTSLPEVYAVTGKELRPFSGAVPYELNYRLCGRRIGKYIGGLEPGTADESLLRLENDGFHHCPVKVCAGAEDLKLLMLSGPTCKALEQLLPQFTEKTGIPVRLMEAGYDELYRTVKMCAQSSPYDLIRLDMAWMSELGEALFSPLPEGESWLREIMGNFSASLGEDYYRVGDKCLTLPFDPSVQILYYRKDLFEDARIRREYYEVCKKQLKVPETFAEYDEIARFFTRRFHKNSPVDYGTSLVFGSSIVAASDYLPRLRAEGGMEVGADGRVKLREAQAVRALRSYRDAFLNTDREDQFLVAQGHGGVFRRPGGNEHRVCKLRLHHAPQQEI